MKPGATYSKIWPNMEFSDHIHASASFTPVKGSTYFTEEEAGRVHVAVCKPYKIFAASNENRTKGSQPPAVPVGLHRATPLAEVQNHIQQLKPVPVAARSKV